MTKHFNESNQFAGDEEKMAYVVREPIVRGTCTFVHVSNNIITDYSIQFVAAIIIV